MPGAKRYLFFAAAFVIGLLVAGFLLVGVARLFRKPMSLRRAINLAGYAHAPRLVLALPLSIAFAALSPETRAALLLGEYPSVSITLSLAGFALVLYSLFLLCWGVALTPPPLAGEAADPPPQGPWEDVLDEGPGSSGAATRAPPP